MPILLIAPSSATVRSAPFNVAHFIETSLNDIRMDILIKYDIHIRVIEDPRVLNLKWDNAYWLIHVPSQGRATLEIAEDMIRSRIGNVATIVRQAQRNE